MEDYSNTRVRKNQKQQVKKIRCKRVDNTYSFYLESLLNLDINKRIYGCCNIYYIRKKLENYLLQVIDIKYI